MAQAETVGRPSHSHVPCWVRDRARGRRIRLAMPDTHSSETVYLSARGSQATPPIHTPCATSLSRRPRFLPRMVTKVPPSKGPLRGSICRGWGEGQGKGRSEAWVSLSLSRVPTGGGATQTLCLAEDKEALSVQRQQVAGLRRS